VVWAAAAAIACVHFVASLLAVGLPGWQGLAALIAAFLGAAALAGLADRIEPKSGAGKVAGVAVMATNLLFTAEKLDSMGLGGGKEGMLAFLLLLYLHISVALFAFPKAEPPASGRGSPDRLLRWEAVRKEVGQSVGSPLKRWCRCGRRGSANASEPA